MKAVVAAFNQEKALVGAFSVITNLRMELFEALIVTHVTTYSDCDSTGTPAAGPRSASSSRRGGSMIHCWCSAGVRQATVRTPRIPDLSSHLTLAATTM